MTDNAIYKIIINNSNMRTYKTAITTVLCCLILISFQSAANNNTNSNLDLVSLKQRGYQIFKKDNFVIKCNSKLKINSEALRLAKEKGMNFILSSYIGSENENSESTGVIYNIQISDISSQYQNFPVSKQNEITIKYLDSYCSSLKANKMSYTRPTFNGFNSVEYSYLQNGVLPTKAIIFIKDKKAYMLQVGTRKDLSKKYASYKNSFKFIK